MSMEAVSGDIFSILRRFATPTMGGTYTNSNAPRPMPPKAKAEANTDAARAMSDPTRYGATGSDAGTGLVPQPPTGAAPPQPVATRVVPGRPPAAPAARPPAAAVQPDVEATGAIPPPGDGSRAAALVNAPDGAPVAPVATAGGAAPGEFDFITQSPLYRFMKIEQAKKKAEADRQRSLDNIFFGLSKAVGGFTGTPVETGQAGARGGNVSADPTLDYATLKDLQDRSTSAAADAEDNRTMQRIATDPRMKGVTIDALRTLKHNDAKKYAELVKEYFDGTSDTYTDSDGNVWSRPKHGEADAKPKLILGDPSKAAKNAADLEKQQVDTKKATQELFDPATANTDSVLRQQAIAMGRNPDDQAFIDYLRSVPLPKRQEMIEKNLTAQAGVGGGPAKIFGEEYAKGVTADIEKGKKSMSGLTTTGKALGMLSNNQAWTGLIGTHPGVTNIAQLAGEIFGMPIQGLTDQQILQNIAATQKSEIARLFPGPVSDKDQRILDQIVGGDLSQQRDALIAIQKRILQGQLKEAIGAKTQIEGAAKAFGAHPTVGPYIEQSRAAFADIPDYTQELFPPDELSDVRQAQSLLAQATAPDATPDDKAKVDKYVSDARKNFDKTYGKGMFDYVLSKPPPAPEQ